MVHTVINNLIRYLKLTGKIAKYSYIASLEYRFDYAVRILRIFIEFGLALLFINVFFQNTSILGNWTKEGVILVYGIFTSIFALVFTFLDGNLEELAWRKIINGELDGVLTKPVDTQFLVSFGRMHIQNLWRVALGIVMSVYAISGMGVSIGMVQLMVFLGTSVCAALIIFSLLSLVSTLSFWTLTSEPVDMASTTLTITRYPMDIFPKKIVHWLTIFPLIFIATVPARALLGKFDLLTWISPIVAILFLAVSRKFFYWALRHYSSASS